MRLDDLTKLSEDYLERLCVEIGERTVGREGNRAATALFRDLLLESGFEVRCSRFDCLDWQEEGALLSSEGEGFEVLPAPYSLGCEVEGELVVLSTLAELEAAELGGRVALLCGELAKEQIMPKNFPFYNPDEHRHIVALLEAKAPLALVTATGRNPELAGGLYPFPMFEDGDFHLPSVYLTDIEGERLKAFAGRRVRLVSRAQRSDEVGYNVVGRRGDGSRRIVVSAHIDSKLGTPGAIDNGTGTAILLLLARLLADYEGGNVVELTCFNGEDYYSAPGQLKYLEENEGKLGDISLAINIDGAAYKDRLGAYSLYGCPAEIEAAVEKTFAPKGSMVQGEPWYQGDHSIFIQSGRPAMAVTSEGFMELSATLTHTPADNIGVVNAMMAAEIALALNELIRKLG